jgi:hypothetical protein
MWIGGKQAIRTFTPGNMNDHLYTMQGTPEYNVASVTGSIRFVGSLDVAYMKSGVSCRSVSGDVRGIDLTYTSATSTAKYIFVCNFTGKTPIALVVSKRSFGTYQTEMIIRISCGNNYNEWTVALTANASFSISYNGTAYVATFTAKPVAGSKTYSVTSEACREQCSRLEFAGSGDTYTLGGYTGIHNVSGVVTTGMARY